MERIQDGSKITGFYVKVKNDAEIYGYQLLTSRKVVTTHYFEESTNEDFTINIDELDQSDVNSTRIVRPIIKVENKSGRFFYLANGVFIR